MRTLLMLTAVALVAAACADLSQYTTVDDNASAQTRMRACMLNEANNKFAAGTLFVNGIKETSSEITNTCLRKLVLKSAGISEESQTAAANIIANLKNMAN